MIFLSLVFAVALFAGSVEAQCFDNLDNISNIELYYIDPFNPTQILPREYILCPFTDYEVGLFNGTMVIDGQQPLFLRSNATIKCGEDGRRENNCTITKGSFGVFINSFPNYDGILLDNVVFQGLTFQSIQTQTFYLEGYGGKVDVIDCAFLDATNIANVAAIGVAPPARRREMIEQGVSPSLYAPSRRLASALSVNEENLHRKLGDGTDFPVLDLTFKNCTFKGNKGLPNPGSDPLMQSLVVALYSWQKTTFDGCVFQDNDFSDSSSATLSRAIISNEGGGELVLINNCFVENLAILALVIHYSDVVMAVTSGNYVTADTDLKCNFLAWYNSFANNSAVIGGPICRGAEQDICVLESANQGPSAPTKASVPPTPLPNSSTPLSPTQFSAPLTMTPNLSTLLPSKFPVIHGAVNASTPAPSVSLTMVPTRTSQLTPSFTPGISPMTNPVNISLPNECTIGMTISDRDRNEFIAQDSEYTVFVNRLSTNSFLGLTYAQLPSILQLNYEALAENSSGIGVAGSKPFQTPSQDELAHLQIICQKSYDAVDLALSSKPKDSNTSTPVIFPISHAPVTTAPIISAPVTAKPTSVTAPISIAPVTAKSTSVPGTNQTDCIDDMDMIVTSQFINGSDIGIPTDKHQVFILCPNTEFQVGFYDQITGYVIQGQQPLAIRSNMTIQCGEDGKSINNCSITTGDIAFFLAPGLFRDDVVTIENAVLMGITFSESIRELYFTIQGMGGDINVIDCRFYGGNVNTFVSLFSYYQDLTATVPPSRRHLYISTDNPGRGLIRRMRNLEPIKPRLSTGGTFLTNRHLQQDSFIVHPLNVTFTDCVFENNSNVPLDLSSRDESKFMVYLGLGFETVIFKNTTFRNNSYALGLMEGNGLITALAASLSGGNIEFYSCSFINNKVIGPGYAITTNAEYPANARPILAVDTCAPKNYGQECEFAWYPDAFWNSTTKVFFFGNVTCINGSSTKSCEALSSSPPTVTSSAAPSPAAPVTLPPDKTPAPIDPNYSSARTLSPTISRTQVPAPRTSAVATMMPTATAFLAIVIFAVFV